MEICIVTHEDCLHLNDPLKYVITHSRHKVSALILIDKVPRFFRSPSYKTRAFLVTLLAMRPRYFVKTLAKAFCCAAAGRTASLEEFAKGHNIPVFHAESPNSPFCIKLLAGIAPDIVIHQSRFIVKRPFLTSPRICTLNRHGSLLPLYRGLLAPFWALYESAQQAGVTVHTVDESIDAGTIVVQQEISLDKDECLGSLLEKSFRVSGELICRALERVDGDRDAFRFEKAVGSMAASISQRKTNRFPTVREILTYRLRRIGRFFTGQ